MSHKNPELIVGIVLGCMGMVLAIALVLAPATGATKNVVFWLIVMFAILAFEGILIAHYFGLTWIRVVTAILASTLLVSGFGWYVWPTPSAPQAVTSFPPPTATASPPSPSITPVPALSPSQLPAAAQTPSPESAPQPTQPPQPKNKFEILFTMASPYFVAPSAGWKTVAPVNPPQPIEINVGVRNTSGETLKHLRVSIAGLIVNGREQAAIPLRELYATQPYTSEFTLDSTEEKHFRVLKKMTNEEMIKILSASPEAERSIPAGDYQFDIVARADGVAPCKARMYVALMGAGLLRPSLYKTSCE